jgi:histidinol-phosphate aminotransferase
VKLPFEPNNLAQAAGVGALADEAFVEQTVATTRESLGRFQQSFQQLGIRMVPSAANFWLMIMPSREFAADFFAECLNYGLIVRHVEAFGLPEGVRINAGTAEETTFAIDVIEKVYPQLCAKYHLNDAVTST